MHFPPTRALVFLLVLIFFTTHAHAQTLTTFGNSNVEFVFEENDGEFFLSQIKDLDEGYTFELNDHPLWSVTGVDPNTLALLPFDEFGVPTIQEEITSGGKTLTLAWNGLGTPTEVLNVAMVFKLSNNSSIADVTFEVDNGFTNYYFQSIDFHLHIPKASGQNDYAITPWRGGHEVKNPAQNMVFPQFGTTFRLPFQGSMQLFPYYTENGNGIYFASEDEEGNLKRIEMTGNGNELHYRYNQEVPGIFTPGVDYDSPYPMRLGVFKGKWFEAAQIYRQWAIQQEWAERGKVEFRTDIPAWIKDTQLITTSNGDVPKTSNEWVQAFTQLKDYYDLNYLAVWWQGWFTDATYMTPQPGINTTTNALKNVNIFSFPYIHSTARVATDGPSSGYQNARVIQLNGNPIQLGSDYQGAYILNPSEPYTRNSFRGTAQVAANNGSIGIYWDVPEEFTDYSTNRNHPPGGGDYFTQGNRLLLQGMRDEMKQIDSRAGVLFPEAAQEDYIDVMDFMMTDFISYPITTQNQFASKFIPLFQAVYHDYILTYLSADRLYSIGVSHPDDYDAIHAIGFTAGNILASREDCFIAGASGGPICQALGTGQLTINMPIMQNHVQFMKRMIQARQYARKFLAYGKMMQPLTFSSNTNIYTFGDSVVPGEVDKQLEIADVLGSVWKSNNDEIGIVLTNHTAQTKSITYTLNFSKYGLSGTKHAYRMDVNGDEYLGPYTTTMTRIENIPAKSVFVIRLSNTAPPTTPPVPPVVIPNISPTLQLLLPAPQSTFTEGTAIPFRATIANPQTPQETLFFQLFWKKDSPPGISNVIFSDVNQAGQGIREINFSYRPSTPLTSGTYYYFAQLTDANGAVVVTPTQYIQVFVPQPAPEVCGNNQCEENETCTSCANDCGVCPPTPGQRPPPEPAPEPQPEPTEPVQEDNGLVTAIVVLVSGTILGGLAIYFWPRIKVQ